MLAQIYGGWQLNLKAILLYTLFTYGLGILIGLLMGFLGGVFDIAMQRFIEILDELPFLYICLLYTSRCV